MSTSDFPGGGGLEPLSTHGNPLNSSDDLFFSLLQLHVILRHPHLILDKKIELLLSYIHVLEIILT